MKTSVRLFKIRGLPVGINWTWLFVFVLVLWSLAGSLFPATYPGQSGATYFAIRDR
jgi:hypothetical protein